MPGRSDSERGLAVKIASRATMVFRVGIDSPNENELMDQHDQCVAELSRDSPVRGSDRLLHLERRADILALRALAAARENPDHERRRRSVLRRGQRAVRIADRISRE